VRKKGEEKMLKEKHHEELVEGISGQLKPILDKSQQAVYIYLDDTHKICNKKFAALLGYKSVEEWVGTDAPLADVVEADQKKVIAAYEDATEMLAASCVDVRVKNIKTAELIKLKMIIAPVIYEGHIFTIHFFSKI
jgi:hypothetical protein